MSITNSFVKKCPRCGAEITAERCATAGDRIIGGTVGASGALVGFALGGPIGAIIGGTIGYFGGKESMMSIEDDHDMSQWYRFKCPNCDYECKEKIHTNDSPDDPSVLHNTFNSY